MSTERATAASEAGPSQSTEGRDPGPAGPRLLVVAGLVWLGDRLLVQRRSATARHGAGMLELPGGKVERGEAPRSGLRRELREEWGPDSGQLRVGAIAEVLHHVYPPPEAEVVLLVFHVDGGSWRGCWRERVRPEPGVEVLDFARQALPIAEFLAADRPFLAAVAEGRVSPPAA